MKEFWNAVQFVFTAVGGWLGYFLGWLALCTDRLCSH